MKLPLRIFCPQCVREAWMVSTTSYFLIPAVPWCKWPFNLGFGCIPYGSPVSWFLVKVVIAVLNPIKLCIAYRNFMTLLVTIGYWCISESPKFAQRCSLFSERLWVSWVFRRPWAIIALSLGKAVFIPPSPYHLHFLNSLQCLMYFVGSSHFIWWLWLFWLY